MHNAAAKALGVDVVYVPLPVPPEAVEAAVKGLPALGFLGANVTVPHKQAAMPYLDEIAPAARAIGAINTIKVSGVKYQVSGVGSQASAEVEGSAAFERQTRITLHGFNTDWSGFLGDLKERDVAVEERDCLVLGAGGSARAVAYALGQAGGRVHVYARRPQQAQQLADDLQPHLAPASLQPAPWERLSQAPDAFAAPLIVNATPVGMHPEEGASPWPEGLSFPAGAVVYDLVYNPRETLLMRQAREAGCRACNGLGMLLQQGAMAFEMWTGVQPDVAVMEAALSEAIEE